jgi:hypothetical protein
MGKIKPIKLIAPVLTPEIKDVLDVTLDVLAFGTNNHFNSKIEIDIGKFYKQIGQYARENDQINGAILLNLLNNDKELIDFNSIFLTHDKLNYDSITNDPVFCRSNENATIISSYGLISSQQLRTVAYNGIGRMFSFSNKAGNFCSNKYCANTYLGNSFDKLAELPKGSSLFLNSRDIPYCESCAAELKSYFKGETK